MLPSIQKNIIRVLKEKACFVSLDYEKDIMNPDKFKREYVMPDETSISIGPERFIIPELMFDPSLNNYERKSLFWRRGIFCFFTKCDWKLVGKIFSMGRMQQ